MSRVPGILANRGKQTTTNHVSIDDVKMLLAAIERMCACWSDHGIDIDLTQVNRVRAQLGMPPIQ